MEFEVDGPQFMELDVTIRGVALANALG